MAIHSSIIAWEIPWTEEPGWPQSIGLHSIRQDRRLSTRRFSAEGPSAGHFCNCMVGFARMSRCGKC